REQDSGRLRIRRYAASHYYAKEVRRRLGENRLAYFHHRNCGQLLARICLVQRADREVGEGHRYSQARQRQRRGNEYASRPWEGARHCGSCAGRREGNRRRVAWLLAR